MCFLFLPFKSVILPINNNFKCRRTNSPTKRHRVAEGLKKIPTICCLPEIHFSFNDTYRLKVKRLKKDNPCKWKPRESRSGCTYSV